VDKPLEIGVCHLVRGSKRSELNDKPSVHPTIQANSVSSTTVEEPAEAVVEAAEAVLPRRRDWL
jgi:hypothetical protein